MSVYRRDHLLHLGDARIGVNLSKTLHVGPETLELEAMLPHPNNENALSKTSKPSRLKLLKLLLSLLLPNK
jgi:hypothetical protein